MKSARRIIGISIVAWAAIGSVPANAATLDSPTCKRALASVTSASATPVKASSEGACSMHRQSLLETVRTRAIIAACKNGQEREQDVARLDGTIESINVAVATSCLDS